MNDPDEHTLDEAWGEDDPAVPDQARPTTLSVHVGHRPLQYDAESVGEDYVPLCADCGNAWPCPFVGYTEVAAAEHVSRIPCGSEFGGRRCRLPSGHKGSHDRSDPLAGIVWTTHDNLRASVQALMERYDHDQVSYGDRTLDALDVIEDLHALLYPAPEVSP